MPTQRKNTADGGRRIKCLRKHRSPPAVEQQSRWAASVWGHARAEHGGSKAPVDPDWRLSRQFRWDTNPWGTEAPKRLTVHRRWNLRGCETGSSWRSS